MVPPRSNVALVQAVLGGNTPWSNWDGVTDLAPFLATASALVDVVASDAALKYPNNPPTAVTLELVERWLAAHYYTRTDPLYSSRSTQGASGSFVNPKDNPERYLQTALELDWTGCLRSLINRQTAGGYWLGKPPSAQIPYRQRD